LKILPNLAKKISIDKSKIKKERAKRSVAEHVGTTELLAHSIF